MRARRSERGVQGGFVLCMLVVARANALRSAHHRCTPLCTAFVRRRRSLKTPSIAGTMRLEELIIVLAI